MITTPQDALAGIIVTFVLTRVGTILIAVAQAWRSQRPYTVSNKFFAWDLLNRRMFGSTLPGNNEKSLKLDPNNESAREKLQKIMAATAK